MASSNLKTAAFLVIAPLGRQFVVDASPVLVNHLSDGIYSISNYWIRDAFE
jgi:hypothetical protein